MHFKLDKLIYENKNNITAKLQQSGIWNQKSSIRLQTFFESRSLNIYINLTTLEINEAPSYTFFFINKTVDDYLNTVTSYFKPKFYLTCPMTVVQINAH